MPSLPHATSGTSTSNMIGGNANVASESCPNFLSTSSSNAAIEKTDNPNKNQRNRTHSKIKLLVRSHAMRESTSPPREPQQEGEKISVVQPKSPSSSSGRSKQLNNNDIMEDSNVSTKDTGDLPVENGQIASSDIQSSKNIDDSKASDGANCSSCGLNSTPGLLQTPSSQQIIPAPKSSHGLQHSPKSTNLAQQINNNERNRDKNNSSGSFGCNVPCHNQCGNSNNNNNTLTVSRPGSRHKLRHRNVSQGSFDGNSPNISRDSSTELYTDSTGIDLEQFIGDTLNRNQKDRTVLLRIERELVEFARDRQRVCHKFPNMSSYNRMLVHRVAAYFGMEHNVDQTGLCVVVTRTKNTRIPDTRFKESIRDDIVLTEEPKRSILKRDSNSFEDGFNFKSPDRFIADYCRRSKSFEEREEEYERARRRIFKDSSGDSAEATSWPWSSAESSDAPQKPRIHTLVSEDGNRPPMLLKVESFHETESLRRPSVPKSYSFGGYAGTMLSRDNSITSTRSAGARLTKQDSGTSTCSRLSPSSSGYKSQSQRSDATISPSPSPSPVMTAAGRNTCIAATSSPEGNGQQVIWAVTNISSVPAGSVIIDPQTNRPYKNSDGSIYRFDPENLPKTPVEQGQEIKEKRVSAPEEATKKITDTQKRRSRYEGQKNGQETATNFANSSTSPSLPYETQNPARSVAQQQIPLVKNCSTHVYNQPQQQIAQTPYASYVSPNSQTGGQGVYIMHTRPSSAIAISPYPTPNQIRVESNNPQAIERGDMLCCNQNQMIAGYQIPGVQAFEEVNDMAGSFVGMNFYDQRAAGDGQTVAVPPQPYQHSSQASNHPIHRMQSGASPCWQSHPSQIPIQQAMYFVPPSPAGVQNGHNTVDARQHLQRYGTAAYSFNHTGGVTPTNQSAPSYVGGYPASTIPTMQGIPGMQSPQGDYAYQQTAHVIPAYYNHPQSGIQPTPVMYGVPTPPNTPTNSQISAVPPLMYVNSNGYGPSALIAGGGQPASSYVGAALVPNVMLRQAVPTITGMRASTPSSLRRASRSPDPGHEIFSAGVRDRNSQAQYQIPMCQGVHIVQGLHGNPRLQYAPAPSQLSSVSQGCARPYRPPSYSTSTFNEGARNSNDNKGQKLRKHR